MASYLSLLNWTQKGAENAEESANRIETFKAAVAAGGGRLVFFYMLMGEYDFATLIEAEDATVAARILIKLNELGNVESTTMRAFTEEESKELRSSFE